MDTEIEPDNGSVAVGGCTWIWGAAVELVEQARAALAALGPVQKARVPDVDRWLSAHRAR